MKRSERKAKPTARAVSGRSVEPGISAPDLRLLQLCFFFSGAAGLIYQVVWTKLLSQLFGNSAQAVAIVLAVFMGGMALGSALFGKWRPWNRTGISLYSWLEFGIALSALLTLAGVPIARQLYVASYSHVGASGAWALRLIGSVIVLALPTILMGGTLPVVLAGISREASELGVRAGRFYAANTGGAVVGTLAAGFFLIPWIGLRLTLVIAVVLNVIAGLIARGIAPRIAPGDEERAANPEGASDTATASWLYLACFAGVGATAIAYEIGWTRLLATPLGSSTYAFSLMLATFLLGIAIGSTIFERWFRAKRTADARTFAITQLGISAAVLLSLWIYREIPELLLALLRSFGEGFSGLLASQAATCVVALLPVTILFGFNFPAVLALVAASRRKDGGNELSGDLGRAIAANTLGAIAAAVFCGFFLVRWVGSFRLVASVACLNIVIGVILFLQAKARIWKPLSVAALLLVATVWIAASPRFFSDASAAYGVVLYRGFHGSHLTAREMAETEDVVFFRDGTNATIAVTRSENYVGLKTNGKVDASNLDAGTQLLLGDLGAVLHPNPKRVLIIGFGGGMTASAVSRFPEVERIDCVEIEPTIIEAAPYLERLHRGVVRDQRLKIFFDDARNFLQTSREQYDLIISEPSNPWIAGIASLYTKEFFQIVREHLAPGGNFVQWIQAYGLGADDFRMILASLQPAFQDVTLWHSSGRDFLVLVRNTQAPLGFDRARAVWSNKLLREDFAALHLTKPEGWSSYFRLADRDVRAITANALVNTDDNARLEYAAPKRLLDDSLPVELDRFVDAASQTSLTAEFPKEDPERIALAAAETTAEVSPGRATKLLEQLPDNSVESRVLRSRSMLVQGDAAVAMKQLSEVASNLYNAQYWLVIAQSRAGRASEAEATLDRLLALEPENELALQSKVEFASQRQDWRSALTAQQQVARLKKDSAADQCRLGDLLLRNRDLSSAIVPLEGGLTLDPYAFLCHRDLGELRRATGEYALAVRDLKWVVRFFPEADPKTYASLALALQAMGDRRAAEASLEKGRRLFPSDTLLQKFQLKN